MKRHDLIQIFTFTLVAVIGVGSAFLISLKYLSRSTAQDGAPNAELYEKLEQVPLGGEAFANGLKEAQDAAAAKEAAAAAIVDLPPTDPNQAQPPQGFPDAAGGETPGQPDAMAPAQGNLGISELEGFLEPFIYDETNRRDPFLAFGITLPVGEVEAPRILAPIQKFPLSEFKLVGVLWDVKTPKAMVVSSSQELFVVERDQSIGIDNGYVAAIRESEIVVVEPIKKRGDVTYKTTVLRMER